MTKAEAIAAWNRRAQSSPTEEQVQACMNEIERSGLVFQDYNLVLMVAAIIRRHFSAREKT
jgi:hypothetical protein